MDTTSTRVTPRLSTTKAGVEASTWEGMKMSRQSMPTNWAMARAMIAKCPLRQPM